MSCKVHFISFEPHKTPQCNQWKMQGLLQHQKFFKTFKAAAVRTNSLPKKTFPFGDEEAFYSSGYLKTAPFFVRLYLFVFDNRINGNEGKHLKWFDQIEQFLNFKSEVCSADKTNVRTDCLILTFLYHLLFNIFVPYWSSCLEVSF